MSIFKKFISNVYLGTQILELLNTQKKKSIISSLKYIKKKLLRIKIFQLFSNT